MGKINLIKNWIFPVFCLACNKEGNGYLCDECFKNIRISGVYLCPKCAKRSWQGRLCNSLNCKDSNLDGVSSLFSYDEKEILSRLIKLLKYNYVLETLPIFKNIIVSNKNLFDFLFLEETVVLPVPLHPRRLKERGFNQSLEIAKLFCDLFKNSNLNTKVLVRKKYTRKQASLEKNKRLKNIQDAFLAVDEDEIKNKQIILVDDVFTTGSTMQECARSLKKAGAKSVYGLVLGRG